MIHAKTATKLSDEIAMMRIRPILKEIDKKIKAEIKLEGSRYITIELSNMVDKNMLLRVIVSNGYKAAANYYPTHIQIQIRWE